MPASLGTAHYCRDDLAEGLSAVGIGQGDTVYVTTGLGMLGIAEAAGDEQALNELARRVEAAFLAASAGKEARQLEFQENCGLLGAEIAKDFLFQKESNAIERHLVVQAFIKLCPGFYPFC